MVGWDWSSEKLAWWDGTLHENLLGSDFSGGGGRASINGATMAIVGSDGTSSLKPAVQIVEGSALYEMNPSTETFGAPSSIDDLLPPSTGWSNVYALYAYNDGGFSPYWGLMNAINDSGAIIGTATYSGTDPTIAAGSHGVLLCPIQLRVDNRDDPMQPWSTNVLQNGLVPIYGGITAGDMVSWTIPMTGWSSGTFTWTVTDSSGNAVTDFNGNTITGPSGVGINEWRIATWSAGGNDPTNQWLTWKPGTYNIKCVVSFSGGGTIPITFQQTVGNRTKDVLVIGWINPAGVSLPTTGVDSDVLSTFPVSGTFGGPLDRMFTSAYLLSLSAGATWRPGVTTASLTSTDDAYILNWLFHFAANTAPPGSFTNEAAVDTFVATKTNFKLVNRFQVKWQESSGTFQSFPTQIKDGTAVAIGTTTDPIWGMPVPGQSGPANQRIRITANNTYSQMNDGSPDSIAVAAFNTLMSPNKWSDIGSRIDFGISINQGTLPVAGYTLENQVYPTYNVYVRNSDGSFTQVNTIPQATNPSGNFSVSPYPPTLPTWLLP